mgnify:CR=1 FL=1
MAQQGLFRKKQPVESLQNDDFMDTVRRTRTLEGRYSNLERRSQVIEENMLEHNRKLSSEIRLMNQDLSEIKKDMASLNEKMQVLAVELQDFAKKDDVMVLKKYIDYWQPLNFVTQNQVEKIIKDLLLENNQGKPKP